MPPSLPPHIPQPVNEGKPNSFPRQLGFWATHCSLTALPSFCIAIQYFKGLSAIIAMLMGVATFVFAYGFLTSTDLYGKVHHGLIGRSIKLGARIRMVISVCSLPIAFYTIMTVDSSDWGRGAPNGNIIWIPDFWFGYVAVIIVGILSNIMGYSGVFQNLDGDSTADFFSTYLITITEGLLISISLVMIAFITLIILNFRRNRHQLPSSHFEQMPPTQGT